MTVHAPGTAHPPKVVRMANQIGAYFGAYPADKAVPAIADHLRKFWDPHMRRQITAHVQAGQAGLDPLVEAAVRSL